MVASHRNRARPARPWRLDRVRTITDLEDKIRDLIVLRTDADLRMPYEDAVRVLDLDWSYDLPDDGARVLREYVESKRNLAAAQEQYAELSQQAVYTLHVKARASVRDIARLMEISYQRVHQILGTLADRGLASGRRAGRG
jgi:hypothetical protein